METTPRSEPQKPEGWARGDISQDHSKSSAYAHGYSDGWDAALAASRRLPEPEITEEARPKPKLKLVDERHAACVAEWPECSSGDYDPRCCRFPKSCSAGSFRWVSAGEGEQ